MTRQLREGLFDNGTALASDTRFIKENDMKYRSLKHWKYELLEQMEVLVEMPGAPLIETEYIFLTLKRRLVVQTRYAWDGPSGPTIDTKTFMRGSLFHDALCQLIGEGLLDKKYRKYADKLLRQHCLEDGMSKFRAWYVYQSVRLYSRLKGM